MAIFCLCLRALQEARLVFSLFASVFFRVPFSCAVLILLLSWLSWTISSTFANNTNVDAQKLCPKCVGIMFKCGRLKSRFWKDLVNYALPKMWFT